MDFKGCPPLGRLVPADPHIAHVGTRRALVAPAHHVFDRGTWALKDGLDAARVQVAYPPAELSMARLVSGPVTKADALNPAGQPDVGAELGHDLALARLGGPHRLLGQHRDGRRSRSARHRC